MKLKTRTITKVLLCEVFIRFPPYVNGISPKQGTVFVGAIK